MRFLLNAALCALGALLAAPLLVVLLLLPTTPITFVGCIYLLGGLCCAGALISMPWWRRSAALLIFGGGLIAITMGERVLFPPSGARLSLTTLPEQTAPSAWNRLFNEQDIVLFGARLAPALRLISPLESAGLVEALAAQYRTLQDGTPLSPFLRTYLGQQRPDAFDALIAEPPSGPPARGIIFLHGFGGNFTLQCWLIARAGDRIGALTVCPSTRVSGNWWSADGEATLRQTIGYLQRRGIQRIYLAGLSNGGVGASRLVPRYQSELAGLILISGVDSDAAPPQLPVLLVHGRADERISASVAEQYQAARGAAAQSILLDGDHFVLLKQADRLQAAIADWILAQEASRSSDPH